MPYSIATDDVTYSVVDDLTSRRQAIAVGRCLDELSGRPPLGPVQVSAQLRGVSPDGPGEARRFQTVRGEGATFAVAAQVEQALPNLAATNYDIDLTLRADGYLSTPASIAVPAGTVNFPLPGIEVGLRRPALFMQGRVTTGTPPLPVVGALVSVVAPAGLVGLVPALAFRHAVGTNLRSRPLGPLPVPALPLLSDAHRGDLRVSLGQRVNLAPNVIVQLGAGAGREYGVVDHLEGSTDLSHQGVAVLRAPLAYPHPASGPPLQPAGPVGAAGGNTPLVRDAFASDEVAFVTNPGLLTDPVVQIQDASPARVEYRLVAAAADTTDAGGFYRIGPVGRTASLTIHVTPPVAPPPPNVTWVVHYDQALNLLDLRV